MSSPTLFCVLLLEVKTLENAGVLAFPLSTYPITPTSHGPSVPNPTVLYQYHA